MRHSKPDESAAPRREVQVLLALTRAEPAWREITVDHADGRLGGYMLGGEPEALICVNYHEGHEVDLPGGQLHAFFVCEEPPEPMLQLRWLRRHRRTAAMEHM